MRTISLKTRPKDRLLGNIFRVTNGDLRKITFDQVELQSDLITIHVSSINMKPENFFTGKIDYFTHTNSIGDEQIFSYLDKRAGDEIDFHETNIFAKY